MEEHTSVKQLKINTEQGGAVTLEECFEVILCFTLTSLCLLSVVENWFCKLKSCLMRLLLMVEKWFCKFRWFQRAR